MDCLGVENGRKGIPGADSKPSEKSDDGILAEKIIPVSDTRCISGDDTRRDSLSIPGDVAQTSVPAPPRADPDSPVTAENDDSSDEMCRICLEGGTPRKKLITPCWCMGSVKFVHKACLEGWLEWKGTPTCELCGYTFVIRRTPLTFQEWLSHSVNCNFMKETVFLGFWCSFLALLIIMSIEPAIEGWKGSLKSEDLLPLLQLVLTSLAIAHNTFLLLKYCLKLFHNVQYCCHNHTHVTLIEEASLMPRRQVERPAYVPTAVATVPGEIILSESAALEATATGDPVEGGIREDRTSIDAPTMPYDGNMFMFGSLEFGLRFPGSLLSGSRSRTNETTTRRPTNADPFAIDSHAVGILPVPEENPTDPFVNNIATSFINLISSAGNSSAHATQFNQLSLTQHQAEPIIRNPSASPTISTHLSSHAQSATGSPMTTFSLGIPGGIRRRTHHHHQAIPSTAINGRRIFERKKSLRLSPDDYSAGKRKGRNNKRLRNIPTVNSSSLSTSSTAGSLLLSAPSETLSFSPDADLEFSTPGTHFTTPVAPVAALTLSERGRERHRRRLLLARTWDASRDLMRVDESSSLTRESTSGSLSTLR